MRLTEFLGLQSLTDHLHFHLWLDHNLIIEQIMSESCTEVTIGNVMVFVCWKKHNFMSAPYNLSAWLTSSPTWGLLLVRPGWTWDRWPTAMYWHFLFKYTTTVCCAARKSWVLRKSRRHHSYNSVKAKFRNIFKIIRVFNVATPTSNIFQS